tara:strand:+ start:1396 stop:1851 length:456 start_codon:yes stop_codon:yes gene_type:complete
MNAKEIVDKFKEILLSKNEEVELKEETVATDLAETPVEEVAAEDVPAEMPEEAPVEDMYATKEELAAAMAEMKAMYDQIMESMSNEESIDVPAELSEEVTEEVVSEELSSQEEVTPISHSPEEMVTKQEMTQFSKNRKKTTLDLVLSKISK